MGSSSEPRRGPGPFDLPGQLLFRQESPPGNFLVEVDADGPLNERQNHDHPRPPNPNESTQPPHRDVLLLRDDSNTEPDEYERHQPDNKFSRHQ